VVWPYVHNGVCVTVRYGVLRCVTVRYGCALRLCLMVRYGCVLRCVTVRYGYGTVSYASPCSKLGLRFRITIGKETLHVYFLKVSI